MKCNYKKILKQICLIVLLGLILTSCQFPSSGSDDSNKNDKQITQQMLEELKFEDLTVTYDGKPHGVYVNNIYEKYGVTVTYTNNEQTEPGVYKVTAAIINSGVTSCYKNAILTIKKASSELFIETNHTIDLYDNNRSLSYTTNNDTFQTLIILNSSGVNVDLNDLVLPGEYHFEVYLAENKYYKESEHFDIVVKVDDRPFDFSFESKTVTADGEMHKIEIIGELPIGYNVVYENNEGVLDGTYYAIANIFDETDTLVETLRAVLIIENEENEEFSDFLDEFFVSYLEGDQLSVNVYCENPSNFGLEHYDAVWPAFEIFSDEDLQNDLNVFNELLKELQTFEDAPLNDSQEVMYETLRKFFEYNINFYSIEDVIYKEIDYIDQFGGYVADFGTYMEAYSLRTEQEVKDIIDYIESTKIAFPSYLDYLEIRTEKGYALSDFTIESMRTYLEDLIVQGEEYYLKDILLQKIDGLDFLSTSDKVKYKNEIKDAIKECFVVGVTELYNGLENYLGKLSSYKEGYLSKYPDGHTLYRLKLLNLFGYEDMPITNYIEELDAALETSILNIVLAQQTIILEYNVTTYSQLEDIINSANVVNGTPEEMMEYLVEFAKTIVPELETNPDIEIKNMDEASAKVSNAVAYYIKSALDNTGSEHITLNPVQLEYATSTEVLGTLAHEGYPGHLYAYVYSKELELSNLATIMTSTVHAEGWATYVQLKLYEYIKEMSTDRKVDLVMDYLYASQLSSYLLEARLDVGIHFERWGVSQVANYMNKVGYSSDSAEDIYKLLIEMPTEYAAYGYGKLVFINLHNEAKEILGVYYDEIEFNAMLLSKGWTDLEILEKTYHNYMKIKCHELGIAFE